MPAGAQALLGALSQASGLHAACPRNTCRPAAADLPASRSRAACLRVHAFARGGSTARWPGHQHPADGTFERVLRYPDGRERRIRYPLAPAEDSAASEDLTDGCWGDSCWEPRAQWLGLTAANASGSSASAKAPQLPAAPQQPVEVEPERKLSQLPASPMELLRYLNSPEYQASQEEEWQRVRGSYEVLDAVPWVAPRPLFLLATEQRQQPSMSAAAAAAVRFGSNASPGLTYSLRTRVAKAEAADELSMVLKKRSADGSALISCSEMKDGVVAFEDEADAERYRQQLEAEGSEEVVSIARCDSHELFRSVQDVKAVVVLLRRGGAFLPQPQQLATALRSEGGASGNGSGQPMFD